MKSTGLKTQTPEEALESLKRGTAEVIPEREFAAKLSGSLRTGNPLRVKLGIDPTAPDIHLGHSVVLRKLRQFQDHGHRVILIIGDFTARIGDPTGRSEVRKVLGREEIEANTRTYLAQIDKIVDTRDPERFELRYNSEWLSKLTFQEVVELAHHFTVAQLLEREDFSKRYQAGRPIGLHEFFYPIMQGFDSVEIRSDVELGGTDQKFNILVGRELQRIFGTESPQVAMILPILEGTDGVQKMSKSLGNTIGVHESPDEMFGKVMSIPDSLLSKYYELLTDLPTPEIEEMRKVIQEDFSLGSGGITREGQIVAGSPREWKARLGEMIVADYHGSEAGRRARENFDRVFREKQPPSEVPEFTVPTELLHDGRVQAAKLLVSAGLAPSIREARRLLAQGSVEIGGEKLEGENAVFRVTDGMLLQAGKRRFVRLRLG